MKPIAQRRVVLSRERQGPFASTFLVLDSDGTEVRVAFYRLRRPNEHPRPVDADLFRAGQEQGWFSAKSSPEAWVRSAHRGDARAFADVLRVVFEGSAFDWRTVEEYVCSTPWGEALRPKQTAA